MLLLNKTTTLTYPVQSGSVVCRKCQELWSKMQMIWVRNDIGEICGHPGRIGVVRRAKPLGLNSVAEIEMMYLLCNLVTGNHCRQSVGR
jgi:hypothetical protein